MHQTKRNLAAKVRLLEVELSNQSMDLYKAMKTASELEAQVEFTKAQLELVKAQYNRCSNE